MKLKMVYSIVMRVIAVVYNVTGSQVAACGNEFFSDRASLAGSYFRLGAWRIFAVKNVTGTVIINKNFPLLSCVCLPPVDSQRGMTHISPANRGRSLSISNPLRDHHRGLRDAAAVCR